MTSSKQIEANRRNARRSTGPRSVHGKAVSRLNAVTHGATAATLVVPGLEEPADWEAHREGILASLTPRGHLETVLAEQVAVLLWRLARVARYEAATIAGEQRAIVKGGPWHEFETSRGHFDGASLRAQAEEARSYLAAIERLGGLRDSDRVIGTGNSQVMMLVEEALGDPPTLEVRDVLPEDLDLADLADWSVRDLRRTITAIAKAAGLSAARLLEAAMAEEGAWLAELERIIAERADVAECLLGEHILPDPYRLEQIARYETHLSRQLRQMLEELRRLQAGRAIEAPSRAIRADDRDERTER